jgi:hypothetical protein
MSSGPRRGLTLRPAEEGGLVMPHESSSIRETRVQLSGFGMGESPRWHDGRLWFSNRQCYDRVSRRSGTNHITATAT